MVSLDVIVLAAFGPDDFELDDPDVTDELHRWLDAYDFDGSVTVPGAGDTLRYTDDGLGVTATGIGKAAAASTVAGLVASPRVDVSDAPFVTVGAAGGNPAVADVGSVVVADAVVDWDLKERDDDGISPLSFRERDYIWELDGELVARTARAARGTELASGDGTADPGVFVGPTICGDEFWHGKRLAEQADWLCRQYGVDGYVTTEMEDAGTATALDRAGLLDRYVSVRGVTNYDRSTARGNGGMTGPALERGLENAFRAGRAIVNELR